MSVPSSTSEQARYLRDLNRNDPEAVVRLYEQGKVAASEGNLAEYLKALVRCEKLNESALLRTIQRGASGEAAAGGNVQDAARAMGAAALQNGEVLGTAQSPVYTQQLEPTFKAQFWRTLRTLGTAFIVLSGIGALADERGGISQIGRASCRERV